MAARSLVSSIVVLLPLISIPVQCNSSSSDDDTCKENRCGATMSNSMLQAHMSFGLTKIETQADETKTLPMRTTTGDNDDDDDESSERDSAIISAQNLHGSYEEFVSATIRQFQRHIRPSVAQLKWTLNSLVTEESVAPENIWMEFGVYQGASSRLIVNKLQELGIESTKLYSFDSFQGLPEVWAKGYADAGVYDKGAFNHGSFPFDDSRVSWVKGWFNESLPKFLNSKAMTGKKVSLVHLDADLYSSTHTVLEELLPHLSKGCFLVFDDLLNYPNYREGELKALWELVQNSGRSIEIMSAKGPQVYLNPPASVKEYTGIAEQAVVRLL